MAAMDVDVPEAVAAAAPAAPAAAAAGPSKRTYSLPWVSGRGG